MKIYEFDYSNEFYNTISHYAININEILFIEKVSNKDRNELVIYVGKHIIDLLFDKKEERDKVYNDILKMMKGE